MRTTIHRRDGNGSPIQATTHSSTVTWRIHEDWLRMAVGPRRHAFKRPEQVALEDDLAISTSVRGGYPLISADELTLCENGIPQPSVICRPSMSLAAGWAFKFRWLG